MKHCCTSAPPTTGIAVERASTGYAVGATKQMCGRRPGSRSTEGSVCPTDGPRSRSCSGGLSKGVRAYVTQIDTFELLGGFLDAGVLAHPAPLVGGDRPAVVVHAQDGARDSVGGARRDLLRGMRQDVADAAVIGARDGHVQRHRL